MGCTSPTGRFFRNQPQKANTFSFTVFSNFVETLDADQRIVRLQTFQHCRQVEVHLKHQRIVGDFAFLNVFLAAEIEQFFRNRFAFAQLSLRSVSDTLGCYT